MKVLLIYPEYEDTFWNLKKVLKVMGKKAAYPPLGLLTVAAMLPPGWEKKLIDMNCENLRDEQIKWADYVLISSIVGQKQSTVKVVNRVKEIGRTVIAGGSLFTTGWEAPSNIDTVVLGEAEEIIPDLVKDMENDSLKRIYSREGFPAIKITPIPEWDLIRLSYYNSICIQLSRGCPYNCEFCDVAQLNGRVPRIKDAGQIIAELDSIYDLGWRAGVFFVDDNLIGNKGFLKKEILPAIIKWQKERKHPFTLSTQVSINLSDDLELMEMMTDAGFATVFVGIETPDPDGLEECGKYHNKNRNLLESVKKIQNTGFEVNAGFILGFDSDKETVFQNQIDFIQKSGIVAAMVGLLNVSPKSRLHERLKRSNRLIDNKENVGGNSPELSELNFIPKMEASTLIDGYGKVLKTIYSPGYYFARIKTFLREYRPKKIRQPKVRFYHIRGLFSSLWYLGIKESGRHYYWNLIFWSLFKRPGLLPYAIGLPLGLLHFRTLAWASQYNSYFRQS
ncbi:MAG: B12-binding domain-containing radical SAM protein [Endomicrobiales bacterium]|nr:B12-binding domain-containing radical SAM protein [Endomicrobiales bacterium]